MQPDARVDGDAAGGETKDGVQVQLCDFRVLLGEARQTMDEVGQGRGVGGRAAAEALDEPAGLAAADQLVGVDVGQGRDGEAGIADQLGEDAAGPEGDQRAEDRVLETPARSGAPMRLAAMRTSSAVVRRSATPPLSVLWAPGAAVLTTAGKPSSRAAATAASAENACVVRRGLVAHVRRAACVFDESSAHPAPATPEFLSFVTMTISPPRSTKPLSR